MDKTRVYLTESLSNREKQPGEGFSILSIIITVIGYFIILSGFVIGGYMAFASKGIDIFILFLICISSLIIGIIVIGFARTIHLLQEINNKLNK